VAVDRYATWREILQNTRESFNRNRTEQQQFNCSRCSGESL